MDHFIIAVAQTNPVKGNIRENFRSHYEFIKIAAEQKANVVIFPELSLTGYEPELAAELAAKINDNTLYRLRDLSLRYDMTIIAGIPVENPKGKPFIGSCFFVSGRQDIYLKQHLHPGEEMFFSCGNRGGILDMNGVTVGLAICADISEESHAEEAAKRGASIYAASVFIGPTGYAKDAALMRRYASRYCMVVAMANYCGSSGGIEAAGRSAVWDEKGKVIVEAGKLRQELVVAEAASKKWKGRVIAS